MTELLCEALRDLPTPARKPRPWLIALEVVCGVRTLGNAQALLRGNHLGNVALCDAIGSLAPEPWRAALEDFDTLEFVLQHALIARGLALGAVQPVVALLNARLSSPADRHGRFGTFDLVCAALPVMPPTPRAALLTWAQATVRQSKHRHAGVGPAHPEVVGLVYGLLPHLDGDGQAALLADLEINPAAGEVAQAVADAVMGLPRAVDAALAMSRPARGRRLAMLALLWKHTAAPPVGFVDLLSAWVANYVQPQADRRDDPFCYPMPAAVRGEWLVASEMLPEPQSVCALLRMMHTQSLDAPLDLAQRIDLLEGPDRLGARLLWLDAANRHRREASVDVPAATETLRCWHQIVRHPTYGAARNLWPALQGDQDSAWASLAMHSGEVDAAQTLETLRAVPFPAQELALRAARYCCSETDFEQPRFGALDAPASDLHGRDVQLWLAWLRAAPLSHRAIVLELERGLIDLPEWASELQRELAERLRGSIEARCWRSDAFRLRSLCQSILALDPDAQQPLWELLDDRIREELLDPRQPDAGLLETVGFFAPSHIGRAALQDAIARGELSWWLHLPDEVDVESLDGLWAFHGQLPDMCDPADRLANLALEYPPEQREERISQAIEAVASNFAVEPHGEAPFTVLAPHLTRAQVDRALQITEAASTTIHTFDAWQIGYTKVALAERLLALGDPQQASVVCDSIEYGGLEVPLRLRIDSAAPDPGPPHSDPDPGLAAIRRLAGMGADDGFGHGVCADVFALLPPLSDAVRAEFGAFVARSEVAEALDWSAVADDILRLGGVEVVLEAIQGLVQIASDTQSPDDLDTACAALIAVIQAVLDADPQVPEPLGALFVESVSKHATNDLLSLLIDFGDAPDALQWVPSPQREQWLWQLLRDDSTGPGEEWLVLCESLGLPVLRAFRDGLGRLSGLASRCDER